MPVMIGMRLFVTTFVLSVSNDFASLGIFRIAMFAAVWGAFFVLAPFCKRRGYLLVYRVGFALSLLFFVLIAALGEDTRQYLVLTGVFLGVSVGAYWLPYHLYKMALSRRDSRLTYFSYESSVFQLVNILCPILLGWLIWSTGSYVWFFLLCSVLLYAGFALSGMLETIPAGSLSSYNLRAFAALVRGSPDLRSIYRATFFMGLGMYGALDILVAAVIFSALGSELRLGVVASVLPVFSAVASFMMQKARPSYYRSISLASACALFAASGLLVLDISAVTVVLYSLIYAVSTQPLTILHQLYLHNVIDKNPDFAARIPEHFVTFESALELGRVMGFMLFLFLPGIDVNSSAVLTVFIILSASSIPAAYFVTRTGID